MTAAMAASRIDHALTEIAQKQALCFVIQRRQEPASIGWLHIYRRQAQADIGELSFWLGAAFQHQGYAQEAANAALAVAFEELKLATIEGGAQVENQPSITLMQRLSMHCQGERLVWAQARNRYEPCVYYAISREQFTTSPSPVNVGLS
jgi:RimJ/RimL family protein N-acetyltransferase